ncbi:MAG: CBS domain-containing protein [Planctomycetota bacterium]
MDVSKLMQRRVATVRRTDRLDQAVALFAERECGSVVVVDEQRRPLGVITDRDACLAALRTGKPLAAIDASSAMSRRLFTCGSGDSIAAAENTMSLHQVRRLPVVDAHGILVGILALDDIAREACREEDLLAPPVSCAAVGRTLGQLVRPHLVAEQ